MPDMMKTLAVRTAGWLYRHVATKVLFRFEPEYIHEFMLGLGERIGRMPYVSAFVRGIVWVQRANVATSVAGTNFDNPIGLAAGFDYEAKLPAFIGALGFGFESVGTVTARPYAGNRPPRLTRLVRSRAILVNKGFKSSGIDSMLARLSSRRFSVPIGLSIGCTNTEYHAHDEAIADIRASFEKAEAAALPFSYYELNISCPNLLHDISFYEPGRLDELLAALDVRHLDKPLFLKMPISLPDDEVRALLDVAMRRSVAAAIIGNLQRDRTSSELAARDIAAIEKLKGGLAGKPAQARSDHLVRLAYRHVQGRMAIVGCGGVCTAEDAYRKIRLGASLVQLAAGAVFMGPQVASEIVIGLSRMLARDGFSRVADAVGVDAR